MSLQKDELQDSWVDVHYSGQNSPKKSDVETSGVYIPLNIEKLLTDARKESTNTSPDVSARGSPKGTSSPNNELASTKGTSSPNNELASTKGTSSPNNELASTQLDERVDPGTDWIWDWSSGPERNPSQDMLTKYKRPRTKHSLRHSALMKHDSGYSIKSLLVSNACMLVLGVIVGVFCAKKYFSRGELPVQHVE